MLRTWSSQNRDMTSRESTPSSRNSRDTSLAKDTLVAWNALQAYLSASAMRTSTTRTGWSRKLNKSVTASATRGSEVPTTTKGEAKKSAIPEPSRRNSGHIAAPMAMSVPARPLVSAGITTSSTVPGGTVLRMTTLCWPDAGGWTTRSACHDVVHGAPDVGQVRAAARRRRRPDTHERHLGPVESVGARRRRVQGAAGHRLCDERVQARLGHRATARADLVDLGGVDVNSPDVVAMGSQAGCRHRPDIAETDHCNLHRVSPDHGPLPSPLAQETVHRSAERVVLIRRTPSKALMSAGI